MSRRPRVARPALLSAYGSLRARFGHAGWWPGDGALEVCVGAVLVQHTTWRSAERALEELRRGGLMDVSRLLRESDDQLAARLRPAGTFRIKAARVRALCAFLQERVEGDAERLRDLDPEELRRELLRVAGIGPETADVIVLYAAGHPSFVVDAYARRLLARLGWLRGGESYEQVRHLFHRELPLSAELFNDFHAQIVRLGKEHCRPRPRCEGCPLEGLCPRVGLGSVGDGGDRRPRRMPAGDSPS